METSANEIGKYLKIKINLLINSNKNLGILQTTEYLNARSTDIPTFTLTTSLPRQHGGRKTDIDVDGISKEKFINPGSLSWTSKKREKMYGWNWENNMSKKRIKNKKYYKN